MLNRRDVLRAGTALPAASLWPMASFAKTASGAANDITLLGEILRSLHPGLYRYQNPSQVDRSLAALNKAWDANPYLAARYLILSRFLATIKCGHSYANFFNQTKTVQEQLFNRTTRLPFAFKWLHGEMVVLQDQSGTASLPPGTIVQAINSIPAKDILARLLPYARADGHNDGKRRALLSVTGGAKIETFDVFHGLRYGQELDAARLGSTKLYRLRVRLPGSSTDNFIDTPALDLAQRQSFMRPVDYRGSAPVWQWTMRADGIAVLRMDGWGLYNSSWDWASWLTDRLDSLKGAKGLIVDIRENEGGLDCGDLILARLAGRDIAKPKFSRLVRYVKTPEHLNRYLDTWDDSFRDWSGEIEAKQGQFYRLKQDPAPAMTPSASKKLNVPMAVLTSAQNSSATFQFAALTQQLRLGTLIGETTGGNQRGINGGAFFFARLPDSGIAVDVPLIGYFPDGKMPDAGITPDIAVAMTAKAIASGDDPQLQAAVQHLLQA